VYVCLCVCVFVSLCVCVSVSFCVSVCVSRLLRCPFCYNFHCQKTITLRFEIYATNMIIEHLNGQRCHFPAAFFLSDLLPAQASKHRPIGLCTRYHFNLLCDFSDCAPFVTCMICMRLLADWIYQYLSARLPTTIQACQATV